MSAPERVDQFAGGVWLQAQVCFLRFGHSPAHGVFVAHAGQLHHAAVLAEGFGQALEAILIVELHPARVRRDANEVSDE